MVRILGINLAQAVVRGPMLVGIKMQIARDSADLTSSTYFAKNRYQAIPKSFRLLVKHIHN